MINRADRPSWSFAFIAMLFAAMAMGLACPYQSAPPSNMATPSPRQTLSATPRGSNMATPSATRLATPQPSASLDPTPSANATVSPTVAPSPTGQTIDQIRDGLAAGNIAFNKPSSMVLDEQAAIHLVLSQTIPAEELKTMVSGDGEIQTRDVAVSDYMEATLSGDNFRIVNPTQRKLVSTRGSTEWTWDVTPTKAGKQRLHLTLNAIVNYRDGEKPLEIRSFHEMIEVNVTMSQRIFAIASTVGSNLPWIAPSILVPLGIWAWNHFRKKRRSRETDAELHDTVDPDEPSPARRPARRRRR